MSGRVTLAIVREQDAWVGWGMSAMARVIVKSEVAGNMWKIETIVGAMVAEEDQLMILESMKMEIPIVATAAGRVIEILVAEGDPVAEEQPVLVIET